MNPKYPLYVVSKGRWDKPMTINALTKIGVDFKVIVEESERINYSKIVCDSKILCLPNPKNGYGSIPARNLAWEHSIGLGAKRHWVLDDNISSFRRMNRNAQIQVTTGTIFCAAEDFVDRYLNVPIAGFQYDYFLPSKYYFPPLLINTRVYSTILIENSLPLRWRGKYNEDTDLCLRALKLGFCTILFNAFIQEKKETLSMKGGNHDLYVTQECGNEGRYLMAKSLLDQHPDVVKITRKYGRYQHHVNYKPFKANKLIKKIDTSSMPKVNDYGMKIAYKLEVSRLRPPAADSRPGVDTAIRYRCRYGERDNQKEEP